VKRHKHLLEIHMLAAKYLQVSANIFAKVASLAAMAADSVNGVIRTRVVPVEGKQPGHFAEGTGLRSLDSWELPESSLAGLQTLKAAAKLLRESSIPVAFPTETVYGLGADATRSEAVNGIYKAKGRPSDNPLIIHVCDLKMLRDIMVTKQTNGHTCQDHIPDIYKPLIKRFWPGPLTILLPNPEHSILAPEVTSGLKTFGVRMPDSPLARSLIKLAGVPIAAPSANASTKPSTTTAEHVLHDLDGRIEVILDGGSCEVGVESTIVDGLCSPPVILRPGGISINSIRECPGWQSVKIAYKDELEANGDAPRAPGMKYKHYSPKAKIILAERSVSIVPKDMLDFRLELHNIDEAPLLDFKGPPYEQMQNGTFKLPVIGVVRTKHWARWGGFNESSWTRVVPSPSNSQSKDPITLNDNGKSHVTGNIQEGHLYTRIRNNDEPPLLLAKIVEISLGSDTKAIAHGLFSALRELDKRDVDVIYVEGIEDDEHDLFQNSTGSPAPGGDEGNIEAAIMNRLRKAATVVKS
jgi:L-threonylcarbamoyladenylate synthase